MRKNILFFIVCIPIVFFISCGEDEGVEEEDFLTPIVGDWMLTSQTNTGCTNSQFNGTLDVNNSSSILISIAADGSYTMTQCTETIETGTIDEITANSITICETGETNCEADEYSVSGNTLTIMGSDDGDFAGCTIAYTLTKNLDPADLLEPYVGTWTLASITVSGCDDAGTETCPENCPTLTITDDCAFQFVSEGTVEDTGYIVVSDGMALICSDDEDESCEFEDDAVPVTVSATELSVTVDDDNEFPGCDVTYSFTKN